MTKFLAIDYGTKRVGLATSHEWLAVPFEVVEREKAVDRIVQIVAELGIEALVLGISEGDMAEESRKFAQEVLSKLPNPLPITEVDETLTSVETHEKIAKSHMPRNKRQQPIDHYAAAALLQDHLDIQSR